VNKSKKDKKNGNAHVAETTVEREHASEAGVKAQAEPQGEATLNEVEEIKLKQFEDVIKQGLGGYMLAGKALKAIRDEELYRAKFNTFPDYCRKRWDLSDKYAYRLIDAYTVVNKLERELPPSPIGELRLPTNESQVRPLVPLEPEQQIKAWKQVLKNCAGKPITADEVEAVVDKMGGNAPTKTPKPKAALKKANIKLTKIGKLVTETLDEDESKLTVPKLRQVLERIQKLLGAKK